MNATTTTVAIPELQLRNARVFGQLLYGKLNVPQIVDYLVMYSGSRDDALRVVNEAQDEIDRVLSSVALALRTESATAKA